MSTSSLVILAASFFEISFGKADNETNRQTYKHTNAAEYPTHATIISMSVLLTVGLGPKCTLAASHAAPGKSR